MLFSHFEKLCPGLKASLKVTPSSPDRWHLLWLLFPVQSPRNTSYINPLYSQLNIKPGVSIYALPQVGRLPWLSRDVIPGWIAWMSSRIVWGVHWEHAARFSRWSGTTKTILKIHLPGGSVGGGWSMLPSSMLPSSMRCDYGNFSGQEYCLLCGAERLWRGECGAAQGLFVPGHGQHAWAYLRRVFFCSFLIHTICGSHSYIRLVYALSSKFHNK